MTWPKWMVWVLLAVCAAGCATNKNLFVLVPDREGQIGSISVTNEAGSQTLSQANQGVSVADASTAPGKAKIIKPEQLQKTFGAALAVEPPASVVFTIQYDSGSSDLNAAGIEIVERAFVEIKQRDSRDISINGHCDTTGEVESNMQLSIERARKIRDLLTQRGIPGEYLNVDYHGEGDPVVPTGDNVDEPRNRRVEIIVR